MKNISLDLIRVTEAGALAASKWVGSGNKLKIDEEATAAIRDRINLINFCGRIVVSEYKKDKSFGLLENELVGQKQNPLEYDIACDVVDGTTQVSKGGPEASSILVLSKRECMKKIKTNYMLKVAIGPTLTRALHNDNYNKFLLDQPFSSLMNTITKYLNKPKDRTTVCVLDRPRHRLYIHELRQMGYRIKLIQDCDVLGAASACLLRTGVDLYYGVGGGPEAILAAAAIKCLGGYFEAQEAIEQSGKVTVKPVGDIYTINTLIKDDCVFCATGITNGQFLRGVTIADWGRYKTNSVFMRSESKTIRWIDTLHGN